MVSADETMPRRGVLVVVPTLNEARHVGALLVFLLAEIVGLDEPATIVVADGGSTDGTAEIVQAFRARHPDAPVLLLGNPGRLQSRGINLAVRTHGAGHRVLVRVDAHGGYRPGFLRALLEEAAGCDAASVVVSMDTEGSGFFGAAVAAAQNSPLGNGGSSHRNATRGRFVDHGHHALMRIEAFSAVGGYDEAFSHNEDAELDFRLRQAGHRIWLTDRTRMTYYPRRSPGALFRQYLGYGGGRARNVLKHRSLPRSRQMAILSIAPALALTLLGVVVPVLAMPILAWASVCLLYGAVLGLRERRLAVACAGLPAVIMHLGWSLGFWRTLLAAYLPGAVRPGHDRSRPVLADRAVGGSA